MRKAAFLDRDGVINALVPIGGELDSPLREHHVRLLPRAAEAIRLLNLAGLWVVVASNQPVVAKGKTSAEELDRITGRIVGEVSAAGGKLDAIYYCLHHPDAAVDELRVTCTCRKPAPGLLLAAAKDLRLDLSESFMVGDRLTDVQAGQAAGCRTVLITAPVDGMNRPTCGAASIRPDHYATDLFEAARQILVWAANS